MTSARAAELAMAADECLIHERIGDFKPDAARAATRDILREVARQIGYPGNEIEPAIDEAIKAASREPAAS